MFTAVLAEAAPIGGQVVAGTGAISQSGSATNIQQSSQNLSLNWKSFNISAQETVNFIQPSVSAIAVNRIFDINGTQILGRLNANGQVYLINPNGILFGAGAQVNVGALVASTLDFNDASLNGNARTFSGNGSGSIVNQGTINAASGGYVALLGDHVSNQGVITAHLGTVALGAGSAATLAFSGDRLVRMQVDQSVLNSLAENRGLIRADGGMVLMTAGAKDALLASVVNNTGVIEARTVEQRDGTIVLLGGMAAGTVNVGGTLDASAPNGGNGGFIETSAAHVQVQDSARITTAAAQGLSGSWLIDPTDYTIAASGGDITGAALSTNLGTTNVTILSTSGAGGTIGNVNVNDSVTWSANKLTLNAQKDININASLNGSGTASLALEYGQGAVAAGNTADYRLTSSVNLAAGSNFSTKLGSNGTTLNYIVVTSLGVAGDTGNTSLQGIRNNLTVTGRYVLGSNIDASATATWNAGAGFTPIGTLATRYLGMFDGLGHTVSGLTINRPTTNYVGLFGYADIGSRIRNIGLLGGSVTGQAFTGNLIGLNVGTVSRAYATGAVTGLNQVGGLVGDNLNTNGTITQAYATGQVKAIGTGIATGQNVGGLVGFNGGTISQAYATGAVSSSGGTGTASGLGVGGLVGYNNTGAKISQAYATGAVSTNNGTRIGGLVGDGAGTVTNGYWNTETSGRSTSVGGTGLTTLQMQTSSAFTGFDFTNFWVQYQTFTNPLLRSLMTPLAITANSISKTYDGLAYSGSNGVTYSVAPNGNLFGTVSYADTSQGAVNAGSYSITPSGQYSNQQGYLISYASGALSVNPAALTVTANAASRVYRATEPAFSGSVTGFVGADTLSSATTGTEVFSTNAVASSNVGSYGITGAGLTANNGNYTFVQAAGNATALTINPASLTVTANAASRLYGASEPAFSGSVTGFVGADTLVSATTGSEVFSTNALASSNVGSYGITGAGLTANNGNYTFVQAAGNAAALTINPAALTVTAHDASKFYDGGVAATTAAKVGAGALYGSDTLTGGTFAYIDKNVGIGNKAVTVAGVVVNDGNGGANYIVSYANNTTSTISAANLAVTGVNASNKIFDGTTAAVLVGLPAVNAIGADIVNVGGSGTGVFASPNVGTSIAVTVSGFTLAGADAGNYAVVQPDRLSADITSRAVVTSPNGGLAALRSVFNPIAQLQSALMMTADRGTGTDAADNVSSAVECNRAAVNAMACSGQPAGAKARLQVLEGGVRLPQDEIKADE